MEGQTLSHYRVLEKLGGGGMGVVYKALDTRLNRHVALKFLPPELTRDDDARERFILEAQAASALDHPNICTIHEIDSTPDDQMFIAMGFYEGETLKKRIERGPLPVEDALDIAIQVAQGLTEAHAADIVHRDIKPANIMLTKSGLVKILDFGIAKLAGLTAMTRPGTTLGTVWYMAPEQLAGTEIDQRADLWALGIVLYEMVTGQRPFRGDGHLAVMNAVLNGTPQAVDELRRDIPPGLTRLIPRALDKNPETRYASASELRRDLADCHAALTEPPTAVTSATVSQVVRRPRVALSALVVLLAAGAVAVWAWSRGSDIRWAREYAIPQIMTLIDQDQYVAAFALAEKAEQYLPRDPVLAGLWPQMSVTGAVTTAQSGADVYVQEYAAVDDEWEYLGTSPLEDIRLPAAMYRWRVEKEGLEVLTFAAASADLPIALPSLETGDVPDGMVWVAGGRAAVPLTGFQAYPPVDLGEDFFIDRYEVTNASFKQFVDAGGYEREEYWDVPFVKEGHTLSFSQAMEEFRDTTGRPGPATWELGNYAEGQDDHPVTGVSWYEADAYARFRGKRLPTIFHWARAASPFLSPSMVPLSNFNGDGPAPVRRFEGVSQFGTYDMAGNVREWCWNAVDTNRWVLGGSWDDPDYMFSLGSELPPFDRSPVNGFRLIQYRDGAAPADIEDPVTLRAAGERSLEPISDETFEVLETQFSYSRTDLNAEVEFTDDGSRDWTRERITFDAGYLDERVAVYVFLPTFAEPPYQAVVFFPGLQAFLNQETSDELQPGLGDVVVKSGRALVWPIYQGSFERADGLAELSGDEYQRARIVRTLQWREDLGRTLDYLETRADVDSARIAYLGSSYGASVAVPLVALETRFKAAVFWNGGIPFDFLPPLADPVNYAPRITIPVLMLNGAHDFVFPLETAQKPLFDLLGTPGDRKRSVTYEAGHGRLPRNQVARETVDWLDKHLGPVH